jgi:uncharacterized membrane protein YwzB
MGVMTSNMLIVVTFWSIHKVNYRCKKKRQAYFNKVLFYIFINLVTAHLCFRNFTNMLELSALVKMNPAVPIIRSQHAYNSTIVVLKSVTKRRCDLD